MTPLQRPARFANKPVLTPEEAAKVVAEVLARPGREDRSARGTEKDVAGAYNQLFVQRGTELSDGRTSLIVDPPDREDSAVHSSGKRKSGRGPEVPGGPSPGIVRRQTGIALSRGTPSPLLATTWIG